MDYFAALRAFVRTVELGTLSEAAAALDLKVSTVSRYVSALEADLGAAVLNRSTRRLHLTEVGDAFFARAVAILGELDDARAAARSSNREAQGILRLNIPSAFGRRHVVPYLAEFLTAFPKVKIDLVLTDRTVDLIETGTDLAIRIGALADSSLVAKRLAPHRRVLVASPSWIAAHGSPAAPAELESRPCLTFALQPAWFARAAGQANAETVSVQGPYRANDSEALLAAAEAGVGAALLPTWMIAEAVRDRRLLRLLPTYAWSAGAGADPAIWGIYVPKKIVAPKVRAFLDYIAGRIGTPPTWELPD